MQKEFLMRSGIWVLAIGTIIALSIAMITHCSITQTSTKADARTQIRHLEAIRARDIKRGKDTRFVDQELIAQRYIAKTGRYPSHKSSEFKEVSEKEGFFSKALKSVGSVAIGIILIIFVIALAPIWVPILLLIFGISLIKN